MPDHKHKVVLRAVEPADAQLMYAWENDRRNWFVSGTTAPIPLYIIEQFAQPENQDITNTKQQRLIIETNDHKTIGYIDLFDVDMINRRAGVGILIGDVAQRNNGYAAEALQQLITYASETLHLNQLFCNIHESNLNSIRLFTKAGFEISGNLKNWALKNGAYENVLTMQCFL